MSIVAPMATGRVGHRDAKPNNEGHEVLVRGAIVDSWVEPAGSCDWESRLVLQVAPRGRPWDLLILEVEATLVPDLDWLADLGENLCHGSPVWVRACPSDSGLLRAVDLELDH